MGEIVLILEEFSAEVSVGEYILPGDIAPNGTRFIFEEEDLTALELYLLSLEPAPAHYKQRRAGIGSSSDPRFSGNTKTNISNILYDIDGNGYVNSEDYVLLAHLVSGAGVPIVRHWVTDENCAVGLTVVAGFNEDLIRDTDIYFWIEPSIPVAQQRLGTMLVTQGTDRTLLRAVKQSTTIRSELPFLDVYQISFVPSETSYNVWMIQDQFENEQRVETILLSGFYDDKATNAPDAFDGASAYNIGSFNFAEFEYSPGDGLNPSPWSVLSTAGLNITECETPTDTLTAIQWFIIIGAVILVLSGVLCGVNVYIKRRQISYNPQP